MSPSTPDPKRWQMTSSGLELVGVMGVLAGIGYYLDGRFGTAPWGVIVGALVGIVGGLYRMVREASRMVRRDRDHDRDPDRGG